MTIDETKYLMEAFEEVNERERIIECNTIDRVMEIIDTENHIANTAGMTEAYQRGYQDALRFVRRRIEELRQ